LTSWAFDRR